MLLHVMDMSGGIIVRVHQGQEMKAKAWIGVAENALAPESLLVRTTREWILMHNWTQVILGIDSLVAEKVLLGVQKRFSLASSSSLLDIRGC